MPRELMTTKSIARACTLVESRSEASVALLREMFAKSGGAHVVGVTGPPGAGKSTLVAAIVGELRRRGQRVAVIAVDPSSPFTGGAILGDRIRMLQFHDDADVFIRSMATRGAMGGLAPATHDVALVLDAAGFDTILVETVGVGQDEVDVARLAHTTVVVLAPGMGDEVQAIKAGILEIADVFVINKADQAGAERLEMEMGDWGVPMRRTIATRAEGVAGLVDLIAGLKGKADAVRHWAFRLRQMYAERVLGRLDADVVEQAARRVAGRECDPYTIIEGWLKV